MFLAISRSIIPKPFYRPALSSIVTCAIGSSMLLGCGNVSTTTPLNVTVSGPQSPLRIGDSAQYSATGSTGSVSGGSWSVLGGSAYGSITANGVYKTPNSVPATNTSSIRYDYKGTTYSTNFALLNPIPVLNGVSPTSISTGMALLTLTGSGFVNGAEISVDGKKVSTTYMDGSHVSANLMVSATATRTLSLLVTNPDPGAMSSVTKTIAVVSPEITVTPATLRGGVVTVTVNSSMLPPGVVILLDGKQLTTKSASGTSVSGTGFLAPWKSGSVQVALSVDGAILAEDTVPIAKTAVSYDIAARFATQAAFGPRPDVVEHIQQVGLEAFVDEQLQASPDVYTLAGTPLRNFILNVTTGNALLRARVAWAIQTFIPAEQIFIQQTALPWEMKLERDAFGNYRNILMDAASDPMIAQSLNLPYSWNPFSPEQHPNQNFARELMQLFSIGTIMLNDDGTPQTDSQGIGIPSYGQDSVLAASAALTGWGLPTPVDPFYTAFGTDYSLPLIALANDHRITSSKILFGNVYIPAGQTAKQDRDNVIDAVMAHQNVPPFVSRRLIQHLTKSQPSPAYIRRVAMVFKDDGTGIRGNLAAVVKAILLDPEARLGDTSQQTDDGMMQDPFIWQLFMMQATGQSIGDDRVEYLPKLLGQNVWAPGTVFSYYSPNYVIPGTQVNSPEFALFDGALALQRSQALWGAISGQLPGLVANGGSWLNQNFTSVPETLDAIDHLAFHGRMPDSTRLLIENYCASITDPQVRLNSAVFLALNSDSYNVVQ